MAIKNLTQIPEKFIVALDLIHHFAMPIGNRKKLTEGHVPRISEDTRN
jgi:hypothetical protein